MKKKLSSLSIFLPAYNEEKNIEEAITSVFKVGKRLAKRFEIIIVNDGSMDKTKSIVDDLKNKIPQLRLVSHRKNKGYGASLRTGFKHSKYTWIFFTDSDNQFDVSELSSFIKYTDKFDAIIGFRKTRAEGFIRAVNAKLFKIFIDLLFHLGVKDIDCAFKLLKRSQIKKLKLKTSGAFTTTEFLYLLKQNKVKFKQLPVSHFNRQFGSPTGNHPKVILKAFKEALNIYFLLRKQ